MADWTRYPDVTVRRPALIWLSFSPAVTVAAADPIVALGTVPSTSDISVAVAEREAKPTDAGL